MKKNNTKAGFFKRFRHRYRLIIYNDNTFEEVFWLRLSKLNVFIVLILLSFLLVILTTVIIAYTPLKEYIPGYTSGETLNQIKLNNIYVDSLENEISLRDIYMENLKTILKGEEPKSIDRNAVIDSLKNYKNIDLKASLLDSLYRKKVEADDAFSLNISQNTSKSEIFNLLHFFFPVKGMVTDKFDMNNKHYGIDIVTKPDEMVLATLDGTVTFSGWTLETGFMIGIQHPNDIFSAYKHLSHVFKKEGTKVHAGEVIGIVGNTGEFTTGPHLHFELWYKGNPIDPQKFIVY
jgi:murein DD-endopeptidase MepM/ murein hydrolase activator NlpD